VPKHLETPLHTFEATHTSRDIHGNVNKKGKTDEVPTKKTRDKQQTATATAALETAQD
jgi:hypothetical protein